MIGRLDGSHTASCVPCLWREWHIITAKLIRLARWPAGELEPWTPGGRLQRELFEDREVIECGLAIMLRTTTHDVWKRGIGIHHDRRR